MTTMTASRPKIQNPSTTSACPDRSFAHPAELVDTWVWPSSDGPVAHVRTRCQAGHVFTVPVAELATLAMQGQAA